jgi:hypothetical protein
MDIKDFRMSSVRSRLKKTEDAMNSILKQLELISQMSRDKQAPNGRDIPPIDNSNASSNHSAESQIDTQQEQQIAEKLRELKELSDFYKKQTNITDESSANSESEIDVNEEYMMDNFEEESDSKDDSMYEDNKELMNVSSCLTANSCHSRYKNARRKQE